MKPRINCLNIRLYTEGIMPLTVIILLGLITTLPTMALPRIYVHTRMEDPKPGLTIITHLIVTDKLHQSLHVMKVPSYLAKGEYIYPQGADFAYTGVTYPFDDKEIWFNRSRTIAAVNLKPVVGICELYLILSTRGGFLIMPDCNARIGAICQSRRLPYELGWLRVDSIKGRIMTVESNEWPDRKEIAHVRVLVSKDGQFRLLKYWRSHPTE